MARVVDQNEHTVRRNEILDSAQKLIYTTGYEQVTIQDLLDDLRISKGAFYHYFNSKQELLEALIERIQYQANEILDPIVHDPSLSTLAKLERLFNTTARWKIAQKEYMLALLHIWYSDNNAIVRQKQVTSSIKWLAPILTDIIRQGIQEGVMNTPYPDQTGLIVVSLMVSLGDAVSKLLLSLKPDSDETLRNDAFHHMQAYTEAFTDAIERVLGTQPGSLCLYDPQTLREWVIS